MSKTIRVIHSPDLDDVFMFNAIVQGNVSTQGLNFTFDSGEIEVLNNQAIQDDNIVDVFAVSFHAFPYIADRFEILNSGASLGGADYGPRVVAKDLSSDLGALSKKQKIKLAIPGKLTTAYLTLQIYLKDCGKLENIEPVFCKFNEVCSMVEEGQVDAGLLIHEDQIKFKQKNLNLLIDLGKWWFEQTGGLNLALGCNVINKDLDCKNEVAKIIEKSIKYGLANLDQSLAETMPKVDNGLEIHQAKKYLKMYVNDSTVSLTQNDKKSIKLLYQRAARFKFIDLKPSFLDDLQFI